MKRPNARTSLHSRVQTGKTFQGLVDISQTGRPINLRAIAERLRSSKYTQTNSDIGYADRRDVLTIPDNRKYNPAGACGTSQNRRVFFRSTSTKPKKRGGPDKSDSGITGIVDRVRANQEPLDKIESVLIRVTEIHLCQELLAGEELSSVNQAFPKRVREFTAGRHLARRTLREMNVVVSSIPVDENRCPVWPDGIVGSISHTDEKVGVALARSKDYVSVGFDIEIGMSVESDLFDMVLTDNEKEYLDLQTKPELATQIFSCKESVYKAIYPIFGEFLDFRDLEIRIADGRFEARCLTDGRSNDCIGIGQGFLEIDGDLVKTLFMIKGR